MGELLPPQVKAWSKDPCVPGPPPLVSSASLTTDQARQPQPEERLKVGDERGKSMWEQQAPLFKSPVFNTRNSSQHGAIPFSCPLCHGLAVHPDKCVGRIGVNLWPGEELT